MGETKKVKGMELKKYKNKSIFFEDAQNEIISIMDENFFCLDFNKKLIEVFQYTKEELIGESIVKLIAPESVALVKHNIRIMYTLPYESLMRRKDGTTFWGMIQGKIIENEGVKNWIGTCIDISEQKKIQNELKSKKNRFEAIFNTSQVGIILTDENRKIKRVNDTLRKIAKIPENKNMIGESIIAFHTSHESFEYFGGKYIPDLMENKILKLEYNYRDYCGDLKLANISGRTIDDNTPPDLSKGIVWVIEDITEKRKLEKELKKAYNELQIIFDNTMVGILVVKEKRIIYKTNNTFLEIFGYKSLDELKGKSTEIFFLTNESYEKFGKNVYNNLYKKEMKSIDWKSKRKNGEVIWLTISGSAIDTNIPPDLDKGIVWVMRDITERKKHEEELKKLSITDSLTGIFNRRYFMKSVEKELEWYSKSNENFSILLFDLDYFKSINDEYGHIKGDEALVYFTRLCEKELKSIDVFGRLGGEEFGVLLSKTNKKDAISIAERIRILLSNSTKKNENLPHMTVSVGVLTIRKNMELNDIIKNVDSLLYKSKKNGRNLVSY